MFVNTKAGKDDVDGVWATFRDGVKFKVARAGNTKFLSVIDRLEGPHRKAIQRGKISSEVQMDIQCRGMAEAILVDWEGLASEEGDLPYDVDTATAVLRYNTDVREFVVDFAAAQENYRASEITDTAKKS